MIKLNECDCEESEETADVTDNIPVNSDTYVTRADTEWIPKNSNVLGRFRDSKCLEKNQWSNPLLET
ncbi:hypothetical protein TNCV_3472081 [Trichonephila clavipes]|nr:hypothetical protein TNCV_3472081 [Trichonephila clavipes]